MANKNKIGGNQNRYLEINKQKVLITPRMEQYKFFRSKHKTLFIGFKDNRKPC
jgi:hypothetical protein